MSKWRFERIKEDLGREWYEPPYVPRSSFLGNDQDLVPGSRALGWYVGRGLTWKDFRSTDIHARNLRTIVFEELANGRSIPDNCRLLMAVTESLSGKILYDTVEKLVGRLQIENVYFFSCANFFR